MPEIKPLDIPRLDAILKKIPYLTEEKLSGITEIARLAYILDNNTPLTHKTLATAVELIDNLKTIALAFVDECNRENLYRFPLSCYFAMTRDRQFAEEMTALYESGEKIPDCNEEDEYNEVDLFSRELNRLNNL